MNSPNGVQMGAYSNDTTVSHINIYYFYRRLIVVVVVVLKTNF
jgi:hypothetical protein